LSQQTLRNIRQNLVLAFVYNILGIPIAAGVLYPLTCWLLSPLLAAAMSLSSVSVIGTTPCRNGLGDAVTSTSAVTRPRPSGPAGS